MDEKNKKPENSDTKIAWLLKQKIVILFSLMAFMLGSITAAVIVFNVRGSTSMFPSLVPKTTTIPPVENTDPRQLLDPIEILKSGVFTEWGGSVEGKITKKNSDSFELEKNGRTLTLYLQQSLTGFYDELSGSKAIPIKINYSDIKIGDNVRGGVTITRGSLDNNKTHHIFANVFTVIHEKQNSQ